MSAWLSALVPDPSDRVPVSVSNFLTIFTPAALAYYTAAVLVILPRTLFLRLTLLPGTLWLLFRAATLLDAAQPMGEVDPGYEFLGLGLVLTMFAAGMRVIEWAFVQGPYRRLTAGKAAPSTPNGHSNGYIPSSNGHANGHIHTAPPGSSSKTSEPISVLTAMYDALDLSFNFRGLGWNWADGWYFPPESRPTSSTPAFLWATLVSAVKHLAVLDTTLTSLRHLLPPNAGTSVGASIYDYTLSPVPRYAKSSVLGFTGGVTIYATIQLAYDVATIVGILILRQTPSQWPTFFDSPWLSRSLTECWAKRWHQVFRGSFIAIGAKPLSALVGRIGSVMGAFFWSAVLHDFSMWGMGRGTEFSSVGGFFLAMGLGCIFEALFKKVTGMRVGGLAGWAWTMCWLAGWSNLLIDAWARRGLIGSKFIPVGYMPSELIMTYIIGPHLHN
ncbi:hypothetical protein FIBSPDRAFT_930918 [Athelia psychrophila]|uniref:Wax synthase domain-containing protein n=1 Tax=Athelia psychrophila TaxID=1759441 RepID=A0A166LAN6_9AGAM|nr:hypothetical protein FIBSPDRAFT_930918 [Fibularhizoctonia sp. CBS 109695]